MQAFTGRGRRLAWLVALPLLLGPAGCMAAEASAHSRLFVVAQTDPLLTDLKAFLAESRHDETQMISQQSSIIQQSSGGGQQSSVTQQSSGGGQSSRVTQQSSSSGGGQSSMQSSQQVIDNGDGTVTVRQMRSGNGMTETVRQTVTRSAPGKPVRFEHEKIIQSGCVQQTMRRLDTGTGGTVEILQQDTCEGKPLASLKGTIQKSGTGRQVKGTITEPDGKTRPFSVNVP